ncbi:MAG TPA: universal stress protein [Acidimicrobiales bacterium]|jgi:nucleotide-binding universal stress UspA family protein
MRRLDPSLEPQGRTAGGGARGPGVVVVGVDGTLTASRAACYAAGVAARNGALLVVVHARPGPITAWTGFGMLCVPTVETKEECRVLRDAADVVERAWDRVEVELRVGDPARELCQVARDHAADLIIVGSSRSWRHRFWGSVAARLAKCGQWPVVVVP